MNGDLKITFIQQSLAEYMQSVTEGMRIAANRLKIGVTDEGIASLSYNVLQSGEGAAADLSFKEYLRMVDMGVGRGHPLGGLASTRSALESLNKKTGKKSGRKPKKFYSKTVYGKLSHLQGKLLYGYTEAAVAMLKEQMQANN